jgi:hypothetical protein
MKLVILLFVLMNIQLQASDVELVDHDNWVVTDISHFQLSRDEMYAQMNRKLIRNHDSICSNRAHVWAHDFKLKYQINTAKIFLFYTNLSSNGWWYHTANVINENSQFWVMDKGFPYMFNRPLLIQDWFVEFTKSNTCKEIKGHEKDLIGRIYNETSFPTKTPHGKFNCYYMLAPEGYWTPAQLADAFIKNKKNNELIAREVFTACLETITSPIGWMLRKGTRNCHDFAINDIP